MWETRWHRHPNVDNDLSIGERAADAAVRAMGSWGFLIGQTVLITAWIAVNVIALTMRFDPYPFILLNLAFSTQAAYAAPLVLLAQRRTDKRSSELAETDHATSREIHQMVGEIYARGDCGPATADTSR